MTDTCQQAGTPKGLLLRVAWCSQSRLSCLQDGTFVLSIHRAAGPEELHHGTDSKQLREGLHSQQHGQEPQEQVTWGGRLLGSSHAPTYLLPTQFSSHCQLRLCTMPWAGAFQPARLSPQGLMGVVVQAPLPPPPYHPIP